MPRVHSAGMATLMKTLYGLDPIKTSILAFITRMTNT